MQLKSIYLHHFRSFKDGYIYFGPKLNIICGPNARGKSSLLEAIHFFIAGRSFRGASAAELVRYQESQFYLEIRFVKYHLEQILKASQVLGERKFIHNSTPLPSGSHLLGLLQGVVAAPDDISLIKGAPAIRRQYLDFQISQIDPLYVYHLTRYTRAMRQRNILLRTKQMLTIESWEHEMARSADYITRQRAATVINLQATLKNIHQRLTESKEDLAIAYKSFVDSDSPEHYFLQQYKKHRKREAELGSTLYGPHKDELFITIDGVDVRSYASEGQQRTCVFGMRCAEWEHLAALADAPPLMLVDDVALGLDERRRGLMMEYLKSLSQVFLTTTVLTGTDPAITQLIQL